MNDIFLQNSIIAAVVGVGLTQIIKQWLPEKIKSKWYTLIFAVITFTFGLVYNFLPDFIVDGFVALSVGNIGYDNILKIIQKAVKKLNGENATDELETTGNENL